MTNLLELLIVLAVVAGLVLFISAPLRRGSPPVEEPVGVAELEAAREAKYREIRDAQLDHATGKLSDEDFRRLEDRLRAEAVEILDRLERLGDAGPEVA